MTTTYPTTLQDLDATRGTTGQTLASPNHITQHELEDSTIEALQAKVGANSSAVTSSHDYKLSGVTGSTKALPNISPTITTPTINIGSDATGDIYYRHSDGTLKRLGIGSDAKLLKVVSGVPAWETETTVLGDNTDIAIGAGNTFITQTGFQKNVEKYAADAEANDTYVITLSPAPVSYATGMVVYFKANTINTGAATLNVNGLGAKSIVKYLNTTLVNGDIIAGMFCTVIYDGTNFVLQNPVANFGVTKFSSGGTTKNMADSSTTQNIAHGLGVIPKRIKLTFSGTTVSSIGAEWLNFTTYNGTTQTSQNNYGTGSGYSSSIDTIARFNNSNDSGLQTGEVTFDSTNIIITWTKANGNPVGTYNILWEAEA